METQHSSHGCQDSSATTGKSRKTREGERGGDRGRKEGRGRENAQKGREGVCEECERKARLLCWYLFWGERSLSPFLPSLNYNNVLFRSAVQEQVGS